MSVKRKTAIENYKEGAVLMTKQVQLTELFTPNLERCFFSSFCIDDQWLYSVLPPVPTCIARPFEQNLSYPKHVRVVFPKMLKFGAMHIKLLLLWIPGALRVVVTSANLIEMDWVRVENILFVQDFEQGDTDSRFKTDLVGLLADMTVPPQVIERVSKFDFCSAAGQLVISKPGLLHDYGLDRMHDILQSYNTDLSQADLVYQTSSLGKLDSKWIQELSSLMRGQKHETKNVTVLFPSVQTVLDSVNPLDGMNMFFDGVLDDFGNSIVKDCKSRSNCLMHSKIGICVLGGIGEHVHLLGEGECIGYLYCGSHNATASAWGRRQGKKLRFWNWELGIVLKVTRQGGTRFQIPFVYPAASFTPQNGPFSAEMKRLYFA